jgi:hypothetical protein
MKFLHRVAIEKIEFLKDRPDLFYLNYLEKLNPMRFDLEENIFEKDQKCKEVYLILSGQIKNLDTGRHFGAGQMIGQDDILFR